jgi:hypothetical protein
VSPEGGYPVELTITSARQPGGIFTTMQSVTVDPQPLVGADCIPYQTTNLSVIDEGTDWLLTDGFSRMNVLDNASDAQAALQLARQYNQQCFIGRENTRADRLEYIVDYWMGGGPAPTLPNEDCIAYNPNNLSLVDLGTVGWQLRDGNMDMELLDNSSDALAALQLAGQYNQQCFIGRNNTRSDRLEYILGYWKTA